MKTKLLLIITTLTFSTLGISQNELYSQYFTIDLNQHDNVIGTAPHLIETINDSLLLIGDPLSRYYLFDLTKKSIIKKVAFDPDSNSPSDIISSKNQKHFIINYDWGLLILNLDLSIYKKLNIGGDQLKEIKLSENGTIWQRAEKKVKEIDINEGKVIRKFDFDDSAYDLEISSDSNLILCTNQSQIVILNRNGEIIEQFQLFEEKDIIGAAHYYNNHVYIPFPFKNEVFNINLATKEIIKHKFNSPTHITSLNSNIKIIGDSQNNITLTNFNEIIQKIPLNDKYGIFISHIELTQSGKYLICTSYDSPKIHVLKLKE